MEEEEAEKEEEEKAEEGDVPEDERKEEDMNEDLLRTTRSRLKSNSYELPGGEKIFLGKARFLSVEPLFQPSILKSELDC